LSSGQVGLAKFRDTRAEFKSFQLAKKIAPASLPAALVKRVTVAVQDISPEESPKPELIDKLAPDAPASMAELRQRAKFLEQQAAQLRELAVAVHQKQVNAELASVLERKEEDIDLIHAALLIAKLDNDELDIELYRRDVERMARDVKGKLPKEAD